MNKNLQDQQHTDKQGGQDIAKTVRTLAKGIYVVEAGQGENQDPMNSNTQHGRSEARREVCSNCSTNSSAKEFVFLIQEVREREKMCYENPFRGSRSVQTANVVQTGKSELKAWREETDVRAAASFPDECHCKGNSAILPDTVYRIGATGLPHVCVECETEAKLLRSQGTWLIPLQVEAEKHGK